jgi:signal transduction histidine kinase
VKRSRAAHAASLLGLAAVYFAAGKLGLSLASVHPSASPVWPPTGLALAAVLLLGARVWPGIFAGAFLVNVTTAGSVATSLGIAAGNTLEAVAGGWLVLRFARGPACFDRPRGVIEFVALAALASTTLSATIGSTSLALGGFVPWGEYARVWWTWWLGDAGGALLVTPVCVAWARRSPFRWTRARALEGAGLLGAIGAVGIFVSLGLLAPWPFICLPLAIWAAFRFGPRETTTTVLIFAGLAVFGAIHGSWPFADDPNEQLLTLQVFMGVISATSLLLAAVLGERARARRALEWQARELARSNAELEAFAYVISHDLKAPLRGISSLAAWVIEDCRELLPAESAGHLALLDQRAQRMSRLIDGVLAYSRVGRRAAELERVDVGAVVMEVVDSLGPMRTTIRIDGKLPTVRYNRTQLTQVFQNLVTNALQHMGKPDGEVVVSCAERGEAYEFTVQDDGVGIEAQHFERIFRMFQTLDPNRETTGVGLTIVKKIVEMHGGAIALESTPGAGATFRFTVPKRPQSDSASSQRLQ